MTKQIKYQKNPLPRNLPPEARLDRYSVSDPSGCILWTASTVGGYGKFQIKRDGVIFTYLAHVVAYERTNGPVPAGMMVCHTCDVRNCINPNHLWLGTRRDNVDDMLRKGRQSRGERHPTAKLTDDLVRMVRSDPRPNIDLARALNIDRSNISRIRSRKIWRHI